MLHSVGLKESVGVLETVQVIKPGKPPECVMKPGKST